MWSIHPSKYRPSKGPMLTFHSDLFSLFPFSLIPSINILSDVNEFLMNYKNPPPYEGLRNKFSPTFHLLLYFASHLLLC